MDWIVHLDTQRFGYFGVWHPVICQKFSAVSENFRASIFREYEIQENYSEWTLSTRPESSFKKSLTFNQSLLRYMPEDISFRSQCFCVSSPVTVSSWLNTRVSESQLLLQIHVFWDVTPCRLIFTDISKVLRSLETSVILSAHTALSPINQHSSRINFVHLHLYLP